MRMKHLRYLMAAAVMLAGPPALANTCQTGKMTCPTTMPVDGYCECTAQGATESGKVVSQPASTPGKATAAGCGAHPDAPGCH